MKSLNYPLGTAKFTYIHNERHNKSRDPLRRHVGTDENDYELHHGAKLDYIINLHATNF